MITQRWSLVLSLVLVFIVIEVCFDSLGCFAWVSSSSRKSGSRLYSGRIRGGSSSRAEFIPIGKRWLSPGMLQR